MSEDATPKNQADRDYLVMMYEEHAEHARQHETLRAAVAGFVIALVAGLLATDASKEHPVIIAIVIGVVSLLGLLLNLKHYERYELHNEVLRGFRKSLEKGVDPPLRMLNDNCRKVHRAEYKPLDPHKPVNQADPAAARIQKAAERYRKRSATERYCRRLLYDMRLHHLWSAVYGLIFVAAMAWTAWGWWISYRV
jgi:hypothetical protein